MEDVEYLEEYEELILSPHHNFEDNIIEEITDGYALGMEQPSFMEDVATIEGTVPFREFVSSVTETFPNDEYTQKQTANPTEYCNEFKKNTNLQNYNVNEDGNVAYINTQYDEIPSTIENVGITKKKRKKRRIKNLDAPSSEDELNDTTSNTPFPPQTSKNHQPQIKGILVGGHSKKETVLKNISPVKTNAGELNDDEEEERELPFKIFKNKATGEVVKKGQVRLIRKSDLADSKMDTSSKAISETKTDYSPIIDKLKMKKSGDQGNNRKSENVTTQNNSTKEFITITEVKKKPKPKIVPLKSEPTDTERRLWSLKNESRQIPIRRKSQEFERDKIKLQPQRRKSQYFLPSELSVMMDEDRKKLQEKSKPVIQRRKSQYTSPAELALEEKQRKMAEKEMAASYFKVKSQALLVTDKKKSIINPPRRKSQYTESPILPYESSTKENSTLSQTKQLISNQTTSTKRPHTEVSLNEFERKEESEPAKRKRPQIATKNDTTKPNITTQQLGSESVKQNIKPPNNELNKIKHELTKSISKNPSEMAKIKDIISKSFGGDSLKYNNQKKILKQSYSTPSKEKPNAQISSTKHEINKEKPKETKEEEKQSAKSEVKHNDTKDKESKELSKFQSKKTAPELQQVGVNKKLQESTENVRKKLGRPPKNKYRINPLVTKNMKFDKIVKSMQGRVASVRINRRFVTRYLEAKQFPHEKRRKMMAIMKNSPANSITSEPVKKMKVESPSSQTLSDGPAIPPKRMLRKRKDIAESVVIGEVHNIPELPLQEEDTKERNDKATHNVEQVKSASTNIENYFKNQAQYGNYSLQSKYEQKATTKSPTKSRTATKPSRRKSVDHNENIEESSLETKSKPNPSGFKLKKAYSGKVKVSPSRELSRTAKDLQSSEYLYKSIIDLIPIPQNLIVETRLLTTEEFKQKTSLHSIARAQARLAQQKSDIQTTLSKKVASGTNSNFKKLLPENQQSPNSEAKKSAADSQSASFTELSNKSTSLTNTPKPVEPRVNSAVGRGVTVRFFLDKVEDLLNEHVALEIKRDLQEITKSLSIQNQIISGNRSLLKRNRADDSKCDPHTAKFMYEFLRELFSKNKYKSSNESGEASNKQKSGILYLDRTKASTSSTITQGKPNDRPHFGKLAESSNIHSKSTTSNKPAVSNYDTANFSKDVNVSSEKEDAQLPEFHFRKIVLPTKNQAIDQYSNKSQIKMKTVKKTSKIVKPNLRSVATKKVLHSKEQSKTKSTRTISKNVPPTSEFLSTSFPNITFRPARSDSRSPEIITPDAYIPPRSDSETEETNNLNKNSSNASRENTGIIMEDVHKSKVRLPASRHSPLPVTDSASGGGPSTEVDDSQKPDYHVVVTRTFKKILLPMDPISASDVSPENAVLPIIVNAQNFNSDTLNHQNPSSSRNTDRDPLINNDTAKDADTTDAFYTEDYSLDTGYQFKCDKCTIILSSRPLIQDHVQRVHFRFTNNCYLCKAQLDQSAQLQHFLNNHSTASISK